MEAEVRGPQSHGGGDTSNPEATPQIPPSCWTSCSLHNRIRMNRPSPALSSLSTPSPSCLLVYTLLALFELGVLSFFPFCPLPSTLSSLTLSLFSRLPYPFSTRGSFSYPPRLSPSSRRFFLSRNGCPSILPFRSR